LWTIVKTILNVSVPTIVFIVLGMLSDFYFSSAPIGVLVGTGVGFAIAACLVARQIKQIRGRL
jgi:F0F1-type ATP synthase assembly protein I